MRKKISILMGIVFFIGISFLLVFYIQSEKGEKIKPLVEREVMLTRGEVYNEDSLINLVHIIKKGEKYEIDCQLGTAYGTANLIKLLPDQLISFGQIKNCTVDTAKAIDGAVRSSDFDCRIPLYFSPIPSDLTDYYLITFILEEPVEVDKELFDRIKHKYDCLNNLSETLIGEKIALKVMGGVIDLKQGIIIW